MSSLNPIGIPFVELPTVDSTNNYAMGLVREGMAQHGTAVFAHEQTRGKGQRDRNWISRKDENIALSLVLVPKSLPGGEIFLLSMCLAVAVRRFFNGYIPEDVCIKWPNDIYWRDRKAAGILIENLWQGPAWKYAIGGIGININQTEFPSLASKAVSFRQITGKHFEPLVLAKELCTFVDIAFREMESDPSGIIGEYGTYLYKRGGQVRLKKENRVFDAVIEGVTREGELVVRHAVEERFRVGEVEWVPIS